MTWPLVASRIVNQNMNISPVKSVFDCLLYLIGKTKISDQKIMYCPACVLILLPPLLILFRHGLSG